MRLALSPRMHLDAWLPQRTPQTVKVTLLFSDVVGSTELTERIGDHEAYRLIRHFCDVMHEWTLLCGGEALELRGDGALVAFPTPRDALACASAVQRSCSRDGRLAIRTGIHTGRALRVDLGYFGSAVITAARIAERAHPREILLSSATLERLDERAEFRIGPKRSMRLKGFAHRAHLYPLDWRGDDHAREHQAVRRLHLPLCLSGFTAATPDRAGMLAG